MLLSNPSSSSVVGNGTKIGVSNGTQLNLTPITMADGVYQFNVECNDTFGRRVNASSSLLQVTIDTTIPSAPFIVSTFHQTNNTDKFPILRWSESSESNFSRYLVKALYLNSSTAYEVNITNQTTLLASLNLTTNYTYYFNFPNRMP